MLDNLESSSHLAKERTKNLIGSEAGIATIRDLKKTIARLCIDEGQSPDVVITAMYAHVKAAASLMLGTQHMSAEAAIDGMQAGYKHFRENLD